MRSHVRSPMVLAVTTTVALVLVVSIIFSINVSRTGSPVDVTATAIRPSASPGTPAQALFATPAVGHGAISPATARMLDRRYSFDYGSPIRGLAYSPDGRALAIRTADGRVEVVDTSNGQATRTLHYSQEFPIPNPDAVFSSPGRNTLTISPSGKLLALGDGYGVAKVWDLETGNDVATLQDSASPGIFYVDSVAFSPDGAYLATGAYSIKIWSIVSWQIVRTLDHDAWNLAYSPEGSKLASIDSTGNLKVWNTVGWQSDLISTNAHDASVVFSHAAENRYLLGVRGSDGAAKLWSTQKSNGLSVLGSIPYQLGNASMAFSSDASLLALGSFNGNVVIREISNGRDLAMLKVAEEQINSVAFSPDGAQLVSATRSGSVYIWSVTP